MESAPGLLQSDFNHLQEWERTWDMQFNPSKCQVLHISRARQSTHSRYTLHGEILESVDCALYLGVSISTDRSWNTHISQITSKANQTLGFVKRNVRTKKSVRRRINLQNPRQTSGWVCLHCVEPLHQAKHTKVTSVGLLRISPLRFASHDVLQNTIPPCCSVYAIVFRASH